VRYSEGMKIVHRAQQSWGVGHVVDVTDDPPRLTAEFPGRQGEPVILSSRDKSLVRFKFTNGSPARMADGSEAKVLRQIPTLGDDLYRYTVEIPGKKPAIRSEADLRPLPQRAGPAQQLASGRWGSPTDFNLRSEVIRLDLERRADALGALFASRVYVKPHQVSVAHQVLSASAPRFVLADEVGLGKTIEAGLVLSALLHAGLVRRCLVVAPSHLTVQWLAELFHKFNLLFTLMDPERAQGDRDDAQEGEGTPGTPGTPWSRHKLVVTSLEWLSRSKEEAGQAADAGWDLVIFDEAHHLRGERAYEVAESLAKSTWGLLLLTATPLQLDPAEYHALLRLVDPAPAASETELRERLSRAGDLSTEVRKLLAGDLSAALRIAALFPTDSELQLLAKGVAMGAGKGDELEDREPLEMLLGHLAEGYGLSARLLRNRRSFVGGFTPRVLQIADVELSPDEASLEASVRGAIAVASSAGTLPQGAVRASLLRRLGSSPVALAAALSSATDEGLRALAPKAQALAATEQDSKLEALRELLFGEYLTEKVLIFAEARETIEYLRLQLSRTTAKNPKAKPIEALAYAGDLSPAERDKLVARFRDPDGPRVLLCTELGGEGRNFQHCHILVNYDLPWSPAAIEQRIGRIDRIGQSREVRIVVFRPKGTLAARALEVLDQGIGVFTEPVGGLDAVLEEVESELVTLGSKPVDASGKSEETEWASATKALKTKVAAARAEVARAYDPLLDRRSCDLDAIGALAERGAQRLGVSGMSGNTYAEPAKTKAKKSAKGTKAEPAAPDLAAPGQQRVALEALSTRLRNVAAALEQRLETTTLEIARKIGLATDIDVDVLPGQVSFHVGPELKVDALAGFDLSQDRVVLGSFRRSVAVAQEENDSFATGHPLVEALFGWVRDGDLGRACVYRAKARGGAGAALDTQFLVVLPEAADLAQGARVPSRRAARLLEEQRLRVVVRLDGRGGASTDDALAVALDSALIEPVPAPEGGPPAAFVSAVEAALRAAETDAARRLKRVVEAARDRAEEEKDASQLKLFRFLEQSKAAPRAIQRALAEDAAVYDSTIAALGLATLELDQVALVQLT
jgi:ATP-dependent helicase HepA